MDVIHCHACSDVIWRYGIIPWWQMILWWSCHRSGFCIHIRSLKLEKPGKSQFWPYDLDLWPSTLPIEFCQNFINVNPCTKLCVHTSNGLALRVLTNWQTNRKTETKDRFYYNSIILIVPSVVTVLGSAWKKSKQGIISCRQHS